MEDPQVVYCSVLDNDPQVTVQKESALPKPQQPQHPPSPLPPPLLYRPRPPPHPPPRPVSPSPVQPQGDEHGQQTRLTMREIVLITAVVIFAILSLIFCVLFFTTERCTTKKSNETATFTHLQHLPNRTNDTSPKKSNKACAGPESALRFKGSNIKDYVISTGAPAMKTITVCLWIKTNHSHGGRAYVSYAVSGTANEFLIYDQTNLRLWFFGRETSYNPSRGPAYDVKINDGKWHHICVTWQSQGGVSQIYKDGAIAIQGSSPWSVDKTIQGGGTWVLGQDQDEFGGGFDVGDAMQGEMFCCSVWSHVLSSTEILEMSKSCKKCSNGNVKTWGGFLHGIRGGVEIINPKCS